MVNLFVLFNFYDINNIAFSFCTSFAIYTVRNGFANTKSLGRLENMEKPQTGKPNGTSNQQEQPTKIKQDDPWWKDEEFLETPPDYNKYLQELGYELADFDEADLDTDDLISTTST
jgi:hypothetical protein